MEKVTLTKVYATNKKKDGTPLVSKTGKPYTRMSIQTQEHGDKWLSGFKNQSNANWQEGDEVELIVKQNGEYLNFETLRKEDKNAEELVKIRTRVYENAELLRRMARALEEMTGKSIFGKTEEPAVDYPEGPNPEDVPF